MGNKGIAEPKDAKKEKNQTKKEHYHLYFNHGDEFEDEEDSRVLVHGCKNIKQLTCSLNIPNEKGEDRFQFGQVPLLDKVATFWLVLDGHGGSNISEFCNNHFLQVLTSQFEKVKSVDHIEQALKEIVFTLERMAFEEMPFDLSGCTFNLLLKYENTLYSCNVGDSKAVIVDGCIEKAFELSIEQNVQNEVERNRLIQIATTKGVIYHDYEHDKSNISSDDYQCWFDKSLRGTNEYSKVTIWLPPSVKEQFNYSRPTRSIAVTSSIGDFMFNPLLEPLPIVSKREISNEFMVIVASDGFWDVFPRENNYISLIDAIRRIIGSRVFPSNDQQQSPRDTGINPSWHNNKKTIKTIMKELVVGLAREAWSLYGHHEDYRDDITIILGFLDENLFIPKGTGKSSLASTHT